MGFESVFLYREIEILCDTSGPMTLHLALDLPGRNVAERFTFAFNTEATTAERRTVRVQLGGALKGFLQQVRIDGANTCRLYGARVLARPLGAETPWQWYVLPVRETPEGYASAALPIVPTPEGYGAARLPIAGTPEEWSGLALPILPSAKEWRWVELPTDAIE